jgi:L-cystine transport system permease protein
LNVIKLDPSFILTAFIEILKALPETLLITFVSVLVGFIIGTSVALFRIYKTPVLSQIGSGYVTFIRGTPMLMHLFLIYYGLPPIINSLAAKYNLGFTAASIPMIVFVFIAFSLTAGAYMSETVRSGILAINRGQIEAAYSIGMTTPQALRRIIFPQALAVSLPNISNSFIGMMHGSTLAFTLSITEILGKTNIVASTNWKFFEAFIAAALIFWGVTILVEKLTAILEKRINQYNRGGVA